MKVFLILLAAVSFSACTEPNPDYDPLFVPPCNVGTLKCGMDPLNLLVCLSVDGQDPDWVLDRRCWNGTQCNDAYCGPGENSVDCSSPEDCTGEGAVCTAIRDAPDHIGTYCIPTPFPGARVPGQACSRHEDCLSGWCFRQSCFFACSSSSDCPDTLNCTSLSVTLDNIQGSVKGCVRP